MKLEHNLYEMAAEDYHLMQQSVVKISQHLAAKPEFNTPEDICSPDDFLAATHLLTQNGIINLEQQIACGLWEACATPQNLMLTLANLNQIATANAALALHAHRTSLVAWLIRQLNTSSNVPLAHIDLTTTALCLQGSYGIGRETLAQWWQHQDLNSALANSVFSNTHPRWILCTKQATHCIFPLWQNDTIHWVYGRIHRTTPDTYNHGLNELAYIQATFDDIQHLAQTETQLLTQTLWHYEWLGLLAIQLGITQKSYKIASEYSHIRYQGGAIIAKHDAIKHMQNEIQQAMVSVWQFLNTQSLNNQAFYNLLLRRSTLQEQLNQANHHAMQMMGGIGYMRDTGIEKCLRDANQLRLQSGHAIDMQHLAEHWLLEPADTFQWNFS